MNPRLVTHDHQALPPAVMRYLLTQRGLSMAVIKQHQLGWNGRRITIPIFDRHGRLAFWKLARTPWDRPTTPKMLVWPAGTRAELYGWEHLRGGRRSLVICEGEFDRLCLESRGIAAVTSTGGAGTFKEEWAQALAEIPDLVLCFDHDAAGYAGARRVTRFLPHARVLTWPDAIGRGGDVTDFFVWLRKRKETFVKLLAAARPFPTAPRVRPTRDASRQSIGRDRAIDRLKARVSIVAIIAQYLPLSRSGHTFVGRCCFHGDRTPSLVVYPATQSFYCFGCGRGGDVLRFLMAAEGLGFAEALKVLARSIPTHD
jgi:DNA primase